MTNPYSSVPGYQFWRRAVSHIEPFAIDPIVGTSFKISRHDRIATAGSCFAQHISRSLQTADFHYYVTEKAGEEISPVESKRRNFGVFSARYGNLYTVSQLLQIFYEAFERRKPENISWRREDGRYVDAFRPLIEPDGHDSPEQVLEARAHHLSAVRQMFVSMDVFVFTLGLTEAWRSKVDGFIYPLAPGVAAGSFDPQQHEFVNFTIYETQRTLSEFVTELRKVNSRCRILLTVSPVPLIATYESEHVLVSTVYSKSVLRVAAGEASRMFKDVDYFPSYEIITGSFNRGRYFDDNLRDVGSAGVAHAMRVFFKHYTEAPQAIVLPDEPPPVGGSPNFPESPQSLMENEPFEIVCDEEIMEQSRDKETRIHAGTT